VKGFSKTVKTAVLWESLWDRSPDGTWNRRDDVIQFVDEQREERRPFSNYGDINKTRLYLEEELGYRKQHEQARGDFSLSLWLKEEPAVKDKDETVRQNDLLYVDRDKAVSENIDELRKMSRPGNVVTPKTTIEMLNERERNEVAVLFEDVIEYMQVNVPTTSWGLLDRPAEKDREELVRRLRHYVDLWTKE